MSIVAFDNKQTALFHVYEGTVFKYLVGYRKAVVLSRELGVFKGILAPLKADALCLLVCRHKRDVLKSASGNKLACALYISYAVFSVGDNSANA